MKAANLSPLLMATALVFAACSKEDESKNDGLQPGQVNIRTFIVGNTEVEARASISPDGSGTFEAADVLHLAVYGANTHPATYAFSSSTPLFWEQVKADAGQAATYTFSGWYNTDNTLNLLSNPVFNAATATDPDLLLAIPATAAEGAPVELPFRHAMHKLAINLTADIDELGITAQQFADAKISLLNMNAAATVNVKNGTVTPGEASDADGTYGPKTGNTDFVVAPQKVIGGMDWIKIEIADMTFIYPLPATLKDDTPLTQLESGKRLILTLTLKKTPAGQTEMKLSSSQIVSWDNQGEIDEEINIDHVYSATSLIEALANASTDPENPTRIVLGSDITTTGRIMLQDANQTPRYIEIDGNGKCLNNGNSNEVIFQIEKNQSLTLKNIRLEAKGAPCFLLWDGGILILENGTTAVKTDYSDMTPVVNASTGSITIKQGATVSAHNDGLAIGLSSYEAQLYLDGGGVSGTITLSSSSINISQALPEGFDYKLDIVFAYNGEELIRGTSTYALTDADMSKFGILSVSDFDNNDVTSISFLYLDATSNAIKVQIGNAPPADPSRIDMTDKDASRVSDAINAALATGITELKLAGPIANSGMDGTSYSSPFYSNKKITKIDLTEVTGWEAVACNNTSATPETAIGLPALAFAYCTKLTEVKLPAGVKAIGAQAFVNCTSLTTINLESVTHVGQEAFNNCKALATVTLSEATTLYPSAFSAAGLTSVSMPKVTTISKGASQGNGNGSFSNCEQLTSFSAPLLTDIGYSSFMNSSKLETIDIPKAETIGQSAFNGCAALKSIEFQHATTIGKTAFYRCYKATTVKLPKATTIGDFAFDACSEVATIELPAATKFGSGIVNGCGKLTRLDMSAAGNLTNLSGQSISGSSISDDSDYFTPFKPAACDLVLNADKKSSGGGSPTVSGYEWCGKTWKSIMHP